MKSYLKIAAVFFLLATSLGVLLRGAYLCSWAWFNFANALHAHSHTLYFGWAALSIFALAFHRLGRADGMVQALLSSITAISAASFVSFLHGGYSTTSIVISSLSLLVWGYGVALFLWRARGQSALDLSFLRVGAIYVGVAGAFALGRVVLLAINADALYGRLAVFGFLHAFAAFFIFATLGLLISHAETRGVALKRERLRRALFVMAPLAALAFPLGVAGASELPIARVASVVAVILVIPQLVVARELLRGSWALRSLALALTLKALMELTGALGFAEAAARARHPAILYLHVVLVGFVSGALVVLLRARFARAPGAGYWLHQAGLAVMAIGLLLSAAPATMQAGLLGAAIGGGAIVLGALVWAGPLLISASLEVEHQREHSNLPAEASF